MAYEDYGIMARKNAELAVEEMTRKLLWNLKRPWTLQDKAQVKKIAQRKLSKDLPALSEMGPMSRQKAIADISAFGHMKGQMASAGVEDTGRRPGSNMEGLIKQAEDTARKTGEPIPDNLRAVMDMSGVSHEQLAGAYGEYRPRGRLAEGAQVRPWEGRVIDYGARGGRAPLTEEQIKAGTEARTEAARAERERTEWDKAEREAMETKLGGKAHKRELELARVRHIEPVKIGAEAEVAKIAGKKKTPEQGFLEFYGKLHIDDPLRADLEPFAKKIMAGRGLYKTTAPDVLDRINKIPDKRLRKRFMNYYRNNSLELTIQALKEKGY